MPPWAQPRNHLISLIRTAAWGFALFASISVSAEPEPEPRTAEWGLRELRNLAKSFESIERQARDVDFQQALLRQSVINAEQSARRLMADPNWASYGNVCQSSLLQCVGDPYRYPTAAGPFGSIWYDKIGAVEPVNFYDREGARLSGRVWVPRAEYANSACPSNRGRGRASMETFPGIVIMNGSAQAAETFYWWAAQLLVENCYTVLTFDPRGQGQSDSVAPNGQPGSNFNPAVFEDGLVDAIDFFLSTESAPYHWNQLWPNDGRNVATTAFNPGASVLDRSRLGIAGHALGARGISSVQGLGSEGTNAWHGKSVPNNPVMAAVAWDNLAKEPGIESQGGFSPVVPRVPTMGQSADYFMAPVPYLDPPDPDERRAGFLRWRTAGVPSMQVNIAGGTHYEWSQAATLPTTDWQPGGGAAPASEGWGAPLIQYYTLAWFDRWLKRPNERGAEDAADRLQNDCAFAGRMSFYYTSSRFLDTNQVEDSASGVNREDLKAACD